MQGCDKVFDKLVSWKIVEPSAQPAVMDAGRQAEEKAADVGEPGDTVVEIQTQVAIEGLQDEPDQDEEACWNFHDLEDDYERQGGDDPAAWIQDQVGTHDRRDGA